MEYYIAKRMKTTVITQQFIIDRANKKYIKIKQSRHKILYTL